MLIRRSAWLLALLPVSVLAGHGLLNSFNDLKWLPAPGRTPDQWNYRLDQWRDQLPRSDGEALFFKEEEVRWSWEMGRRAREIQP